jgi:(5-formylfuran-3-yl)methyl phosphate synthase
MTQFRSLNLRFDVCSNGPRLLVSVRSYAEAVRAVDGGADIIDVKEPMLGSLGMAGSEVIFQIATGISRGMPVPPISVALGELADWPEGREVPELPAAVTFAKLGLSNTARTTDWIVGWNRVRNQFDHRCEQRLNWVAVAYADDVAAQSPPLDDVLSAAIETRCAGLLIDTYGKSGKSLLDFVGMPKLKQIVRRCHDASLFLALAGSLKTELLPALSGLCADVLAIRSAACRHADRRGEVDSALVRTFRNTMSNSLSAQSVPH